VESGEGMEGERRLAYVAFTWTQEHPRGEDLSLSELPPPQQAVSTGFVELMPGGWGTGGVTRAAPSGLLGPPLRGTGWAAPLS
jgi:hypothetical protein